MINMEELYGIIGMMETNGLVLKTLSLLLLTISLSSEMIWELFLTVEVIFTSTDSQTEKLEEKSLSQKALSHELLMPPLIKLLSKKGSCLSCSLKINLKNLIAQNEYSLLTLMSSPYLSTN